MRMTRERRRLVTAAVALTAGLGLAGAAGLAAQQPAAAKAAASAGPNGSWPQFRGPNRDGRSADAKNGERSQASADGRMDADLPQKSDRE